MVVVVRLEFAQGMRVGMGLQPVIALLVGVRLVLACPGRRMRVLVDVRMVVVVAMLVVVHDLAVTVFVAVTVAVRVAMLMAMGMTVGHGDNPRGRGQNDPARDVIMPRPGPTTRERLGVAMLDEDFWVFGYGSLMWRPGFAYRGVRRAVLGGYHRSFCVYSHHYRGTPAAPGLVLGLDPGGSCEGLAFRVAADEAADVKAYLDERELVSYAYRPLTLPVTTAEGEVMAYTFVADPGHRLYAGKLGLEEAAQTIMRAQGVAGLNREYLINTVRSLERHGFVEPELHALLKRVEHLTGIIEAGGGI